MRPTQATARRAAAIEAPFDDDVAGGGDDLVLVLVLAAAAVVLMATVVVVLVLVVAAAETKHTCTASRNTDRSSVEFGLAFSNESKFLPDAAATK